MELFFTIQKTGHDICGNSKRLVCGYKKTAGTWNILSKEEMKEFGGTWSKKKCGMSTKRDTIDILHGLTRVFGENYDFCEVSS